MTTRIIFIMVFLGVLNGASAQDDIGAADTASSDYPQWPRNKNLCMDDKGCICKKDFSKLPATSPKGMLLDSVCDYQSRPYFMAGTFYFRGDVTVHGKLVSELRGGEEGAGVYDWFYGEGAPKPFSPFSSVVGDLNLAEGSSPQNIPYPALSEENNCWTAEATLRIKLLKVVAGDQDDAGNFPLKYEVVRVGKFSKCKLQ